MGASRRKTWVNIAAAILVALALFTCVIDSVEAQTPPPAQNISVPTVAPDDNNGPGTLSKNLGITGYKATVFEVLTALGAMIAWLGGSMLDISISVFTAGMKQTVDYLKLGVAIEQMWAIVRDMFNLLFIFGLIFAGFKIILDANDSASKRTVGMIVVAALLINFSLYAAQVVVDFTNVAAYQIHQLIAKNDKSGSTIFGIPVPNTTDQFVNFSGIEGTGNKDQAAALAKEVGSKTGQSEADGIGTAIVLGLLFCIFYIILGFIFAACAVVLFTRFFALVFLMIFSPLMFLGWVLPNMKHLSSQWWKYFSNQALVGPALLFMIYLSLRALQGIGPVGQNGGLMAIMLYLLIVTAFLIASLKVAKSFGAYGTQTMMNIGNNLQGKARVFAGNASFGLAARTGRATLGRMAQSISERDSLRDAASRGGLRGWAARRALDTTSAVGDASFDARKVGGVGKKLGIGTGVKGGYKTATEAVAKREKEYAKKLGEVSDDDPRMKALQEDIEATDNAIKNQKRAVTEAKKKGKAEEISREQGKLEELEALQSDNKEKREAEKYRRQLGNTAQLPENFKLDINNRKNKIKKAQSAYALLLGKKEDDITDADRAQMESLRSEIAQQKKDLSEVEKEAANLAGGYANTVENFGFIRRWTGAGNKPQNKDAAKAIIDEYKKKVKSKDKGKDKSEAKDDKKEEPKAKEGE